MFISFEGLDGSGKTTQATLLAEKLRSQNYVVEFSENRAVRKFPERIREILLDKKNLGMTQIYRTVPFLSSTSSTRKRGH